jgi:hypothetical protein
VFLKEFLMELKAKETITVSALVFLVVVVVATLGWLLLFFLIATDQHGPTKILLEVAIEGLKVVAIGAAAAIVLELFLRRTSQDTPEALLQQVGISEIFQSRIEHDAITEFLRLVKEPNVRRIVICGISLRDFLLNSGALHSVWRAIQDRLNQEQRSDLQPHQRLHVRVLLLEPGSNEGCFRDEVERHTEALPGGGIPFDVPQGIATVVSAQHAIYRSNDTAFLQVRLYEHCPFAFVFATDATILVEQYDYRNQSEDPALPLLEYKSGSRQFKELFASVETIWKHARPTEILDEIGTATALREAKIRNIFRHGDREHLSKRQADAVRAASGESIRILAVSGKFYTSNPIIAPLIRQNSKPTDSSAGTRVLMAIANPTSQQAILRAVADETPANEMRKGLEEWTWAKHQRTALYKDTINTGMRMEQWKAKGSQIQVRLYSSSIACAMLMTDKSAFVEQYVPGRSKIFQPGLALGGEYPIIEYEIEPINGRSTIEKEVIEESFDIVWDSYTVAWEDYSQRDLEEEFKRNLTNLLTEIDSTGENLAAQNTVTARTV